MQYILDKYNSETYTTYKNCNIYFAKVKNSITHEYEREENGFCEKFEIKISKNRTGNVTIGTCQKGRCYETDHWTDRIRGI